MDDVKILVTLVSPYSIQEGKSVSSGITVNYFFWGENGETMRSMNDLSGGSVGSNRAKVSLENTPQMRDKFSFVPGVYTGKMAMTVGSDGKPVLKLVDITGFLGKVEMKLVPEHAK